MLSFKHVLLCIILHLFALLGNSQGAIDSLRSVLNSSSPDTNKVNTLFDIAFAHNLEKDSALPYLEEALELSKQLNDFKFQALSEKYIGVVYYYVADYETCLPHWEQSIDFFEKAGDQQAVGNTYNNIGNIYSKQNQYQKALDYFHRCLDISLKTNNARSIAASYGNIGNIYFDIQDYRHALEYHQKSITIDSTNNSLQGLSVSYINLAAIYNRTGAYDRAKEVAEKALELNTELNDELGISAAHENLGNVFLELGDYNTAIEHQLISFEIDTKYSNQTGIAVSCNGLAESYLQLKRYQEALNYAQKGVDIAKNIGTINIESAGHSTLSRIYEKLGNSTASLKALRTHIELEDQVNGAEASKAIIHQELDFHFQKQRLADSLKRMEADKIQQLEVAQANEDLERQEWFTNLSIIVGIAFAAVLGFIIYLLVKHYRNKELHNQVVVHQKLQLEEKNEEITSSIRYAQRIQEVIFPQPEFYQELLPHSFVFFKPKDLVSGDFYWIAKKDDRYIISVVDCTGHGVPGAFISIVGHYGLKSAIHQEDRPKPSQILSALNEEVNNTLKQKRSNSTIKDGMDLSLCIFNHDQQVLEFAGANNPIYIVENGKLTEIKGDKKSIGGFIDEGQQSAEFTDHQIKLNKGSMVYLFTDGFADQFGGEKGKKFKYRQFKEMLTGIAHLPTQQQREHIQTRFNDWSSNYEQIDDITVFGFRVV